MMDTLFFGGGLIPPINPLKRRTRTRTKQDSPSKAKPLDILPGVSEVDESRLSTSTTSSTCAPAPSYCASRSAGGNVTLGARPTQDLVDRKRDSRRVVLTGAEGITFDDFFPMSNTPLRPISRAPASKPIMCDSPLDDIDLRFSGLGIALDFPSPPRKSSGSYRRDHSPTPSVSSSHTSSTSSSDSSSTSTRVTPFTPPTSDDESVSQAKSRLTRAPTCKSQRASILFMKSMPDLHKQPVLRSVVPSMEDDEEEWSDGEDASWFAQDIGDLITLSSPNQSSSASHSDLCARRDSLPPPPRAESNATSGCSRYIKPVPVVPHLSITSRGPSAQLDPTFHMYKKPRRAIPSRPPPPPPIFIECCEPSSPISTMSKTMEEKTDELLALLANAALGIGFLGTGLTPAAEEPASTPISPNSIFAIGTPRPPPRSSIPADIFDDDTLLLEDDRESDCGLTPSTPQSISVYSQSSMNVSVDSLPLSPISSFSFEMDASDRTPVFPDNPVAVPERTLRSRWSSSTLGSFDANRQPQSAASWMLKFHLGSPSKKASKFPSRSSKPKYPNVPLSPSSKKSLEATRESRGLERRDSTNSRASSDCASESGESTSSSGLRRKPIPIEIFMRA